MIYLNKIFKIPGPKDLGMSDSNFAMPSKFFSNDDEDTWESYYARVKKDYPIRYFLASTLIEFFARRFRYIRNRLADIMYFFKCHVIKKYKYHMLDLRQPKKVSLNIDDKIIKIDNPDSYTYGWVDIDNRMLFAVFGLLNQYVDNELKVLSDEDVAGDPFLQKSKDLQKEILEIHHWWNVERKQDLEMCSALCDKWHFLATKKQKVAKDRAWQELRDAEQAIEDKTDEMLARLMKIRRSLWS